jgi:hypothetical protein
LWVICLIFTCIMGEIKLIDYIKSREFDYFQKEIFFMEEFKGFEDVLYSGYLMRYFC